MVIVRPPNIGNRGGNNIFFMVMSQATVQIAKLEAHTSKFEENIRDLYLKCSKITEQLADHKAKITALLMLNSLILTGTGFLIYKLFDIASKIK